MSRVFTRSAKGFRETSGRSKELSDELGELLRSCKGQFSLEDFAANCSESEREILTQSLNTLVEQGFLREIHELGQDSQDELARREAEEVARLEAEEKLRLEAEDKVREAAEEKDRLKAEADAKEETKERARLAAAAKARAEQEAKDQARREEEVQREQIKDRVRQRSDGDKGSLIKTALVVIVLGLVLSTALLHFVPFDGARKGFVKVGQELTGSEVKIDSAYFSLFPKPSWELHDVRIGAGDGAVRIEKVVVGASVMSLVSLPKQFTSLHLVAPSIPPSVVAALLRGSEGEWPVSSGNVSAAKLVLLDQKELVPPLDVEAIFLKGQLAQVSANGQSENTGKVNLVAARNPTHWRLSGSAQRFVVPLGVDLAVTDFSAKAELTADTLTVTEFSGRRHDGVMTGNVAVTWQPVWKATGHLETVRMDIAQLAPGWGKDGVVSGTAELTAEAQSLADLYSGSLVEGSFKTDSGFLLGIDLDRVVQGRGLGDRSRFETIEGRVRLVGGRVEIPEVTVKAGALVSKGSLTMKADRSVTGRFGVEVHTPSGKLAASYTLTGSADKPQYQR